MKRSLVSLVVITSVCAIAFSLANAFFSDTETSTANTFQAGAIDLKMGNESYYNGVFNEATSWDPSDLDGETFRFFNFLDLKPGDWGKDTISLRVDTNDAWGCYEVTLTSNDDNTCTEPELQDDPLCDPDNPWTGDLADQVNFVFWLDDGDDVYEDGEEIITQGTIAQALQGLKGPLADSTGGILGLENQPMEGEKTYNIGKAWCFGELSFDPTTASGISCNGQTVNNAAQTDSLTADVIFSVIQARNNPVYVCPRPISCELGQVFTTLSSNEWFNQGKRKNNTAVLTERSDPTKATGAPEGTITPPSFISLGFGGSIILGFSGPVGNGPGYDLILHEITGGRASYPEERAKVEVSQNIGGPWSEIGISSSKDPDGKSYLDISTGAPHLSYIQYVRVTDVSDPAPFEATADGYDLDAIEARYGACVETNNSPAD